MRPVFLLTALLLCLTLAAQKKKNKDKETLSPEQSKDILSKINIDTMNLMRDYATEACLCIDSIKLSGRSNMEITGDIAKCIDKQVAPFQLVLQMWAGIVSGSKEIVVDDNKNSSAYRLSYFKMEAWLRDSCHSLQAAVASHNKESDKSTSDDPEALDAYNKGIEALRKNDPVTASLLFTRAVGIDPEFAFAWDNLGIAFRRQGKLDEALAAYKKSLELDPNGITPLHNIPIVYEYQKKYDEAIAAFGRLLELYPDDPEGHYGAGRIYIFYKEDHEKGLQEMCKAYVIYTKSNSPYRVDAEKNINILYTKMKEKGKEARFYEILKENGLNPK